MPLPLPLSGPTLRREPQFNPLFSTSRAEILTSHAVPVLTRAVLNLTPFPVSHALEGLRRAEPRHR
jgi:hypothetical protein